MVALNLAWWKARMSFEMVQVCLEGVLDRKKNSLIIDKKMHFLIFHDWQEDGEFV